MKEHSTRTVVFINFFQNILKVVRLGNEVLKIVLVQGIPLSRHEITF